MGDQFPQFRVSRERLMGHRTEVTVSCLLQAVKTLLSNSSTAKIMTNSGCLKATLGELYQPLHFEMLTLNFCFLFRVFL